MEQVAIPRLSECHGSSQERVKEETTKRDYGRKLENSSNTYYRQYHGQATELSLTDLLTRTFSFGKLFSSSSGICKRKLTINDLVRRADFMYMVPPFLAYYGVMSQNTSLVEEAFNQLKLYRNYLGTDSSKALRHVVLGDWQDNGLWATGNGWAAAGEFPFLLRARRLLRSGLTIGFNVTGMTRVAATMQNSQYASRFANEIGNLKEWTNEILEASFSYLRVR
jgi:hypothetical protein